LRSTPGYTWRHRWAVNYGERVSSSCFELVIFDCDGVLVDSELITSRVFASMLNELGICVTHEDMFARFVGRSMGQCLEVIEGMLGHAVPADFVGRFHIKTAIALRSDLKAIPGVEAALNAIKVPYCVASSGSHEKMQMTLGITGLMSKFRGRLFSITEVARPKPFPDVFLHAAKQLGVAASACAVIEDTPTGVAAGVAAGMKVFGFCAYTPKAQLQNAGAHVTFDSMSSLPDLLQGAA
jgi:HAD superfamily hydrolase (TIGR01509 family)